MTVAEEISDGVRAVIAAEIAKQRVKKTKLAERCGISYDRLNHFFRTDNPTIITAEDEEMFRKALGKPEGWPRSVLRQPDSPGFWSIAESGQAYEQGQAFQWIEGSDQPKTVPAEFLGYDWQGIVMPDDSMMKAIHVGDLLAISPKLKPRLEFPHCVHVDGKPTIRIIDHDGRDYVVTALHPKYPSAPLESEFVGLVVGHVWTDENGDRRSRVNPMGIKIG